jgi:hypothetical protein
MSTAPRSGLPVPRASRALDNLRGFVILLVLAFHSVLAYLNSLPASPFPFDTPPHLWRAFPIVDTERWFGFDLFCAWQDVFLMSLFFFLSGLFVWPSLERKGARIFLRDRVLRIGVPFTLAVVLLMPLANYPTYLQTAVDPGVPAFWRHSLALPFWPCGPMWLLLVADFCRRRAARILTPMGRCPDPVFVFCRRPAHAIFCRIGDRLGPRLRPAGRRLHAVGVVGLRAVRVPA